MSTKSTTTSQTYQKLNCDGSAKEFGAAGPARILYMEEWLDSEGCGCCTFRSQRCGLSTVSRGKKLRWRIESDVSCKHTRCYIAMSHAKHRLEIRKTLEQFFATACCILRQSIRHRFDYALPRTMQRNTGRHNSAHK